ncbi:MAG: flagellin, partial [Eubacterium sp.]|nr:flagellin [Eubacterium sp.]
MVVQHNITSMNANRQLGIVGNNVAKATEKLSSGYRVNKAADDA